MKSLLLKDKDFMSSIKLKIHSIVEDGKINHDDMFKILDLVVFMLKSQTNHNISHTESTDVIYEIITEILHEIYDINLMDTEHESMNTTLKMGLRLVSVQFSYNYTYMISNCLMKLLTNVY
jgi:hypothetical protein